MIQKYRLRLLCFNSQPRYYLHTNSISASFPLEIYQFRDYDGYLFITNNAAMGGGGEGCVRAQFNHEGNFIHVQWR